MTLALQGIPSIACDEHELVAAVRRGDDRAFEALFARYERRITGYVTGMVGHPGAFPLRNSMGVLQALALAGGLAEFADRDTIHVLRADGRRVEVAYQDLVTGRSKVTLGPGDTVVVP